MNGWVRLWILLSVIWAVIVISMSALIVPDMNTQPSLTSIKYRLSKESKAFYEGLEAGEEGPSYTVSFEYTDGTEQVIKFPLLEKDISELKIDEKLRNLAEEDGLEINQSSIDEFIEKVKQKNLQALQAKKEFQAKIENAKSEKMEERKEVIRIAAFTLVIPPLLLLLLGYGVAWVRRGFKNHA